MVHLYPLLLGLMIIVEGGQKNYKSWRWWRTPRKPCSPDASEQLHKGTHRGYENMHKAYANSSQTKLQHGVGKCV